MLEIEIQRAALHACFPGVRRRVGWVFNTVHSVDPPTVACVWSILGRGLQDHTTVLQHDHAG